MKGAADTRLMQAADHCRRDLRAVIGPGLAKIAERMPAGAARTELERLAGVAGHHAQAITTALKGREPRPIRAGRNLPCWATGNNAA